MASKNGKPKLTSDMIQAYIRVRPLDPQEEKSPLLEFGRNEVTIKGESGRPKTLTFDRVFGESASQKRVYDHVVEPMVKEVLSGYNCTIFSYGQTGTGKTYTMTGDYETLDGNSIHAGMIPRAMNDIFQAVEKLNCEYQVKISYLELYNEKMRSLLESVDDDFNIQLLDDMDGNIILKGLTLTTIKSKEEALKLLKVGMEKKKMASTKMNINSSRSHTVFTITVSVKETETWENDDVVRIGKLHLVDLAGSENASKAGANEAVGGVKKRLNEMSNINRSLLTLGRVITCITENNPHIPYRESKLTRFLKDSLGGKTKTCVVGTISPTDACLDETENTLNYASKVRLIKNKPEKNEKVSKKEFMQVAADELMKLKRDLEAAKSQQGSFVLNEWFIDTNRQLEELSAQVKSATERYNALTDDYNKKMELFNSLKGDLDEKNEDIDELQAKIEYESERFKEKLEVQSEEIQVRERLLRMLARKEEKLKEQAIKSRSELINLHEENEILHNKVDRQRNLELDNLKVLDTFKTEFEDNLENRVTRRLQSLYREKSDDYLKLGNAAKDLVFVVKGKHQFIDEQLEEIQRMMVQHMEDSQRCTAALGQDIQDNAGCVEPNMEVFISKIESVRGMLYEILTPNIDNVKAKLSSMKNSGQGTLEYLRKCQLKKELSMEEVAINSDKFEEIKMAFKHEMQILQDNVGVALKKTHEANTKAKFAAKKVKALKLAALDAEKYTSKALEACVDTEKVMKSISECIDCVGTYIQDDLETYKVCEAETFRNITEQDELSLEFRTDYQNQLREKKDDVLQEAAGNFARIGSKIKKHVLEPVEVGNPVPVIEGRVATLVMNVDFYKDHAQRQGEDLIVSTSNVVNELVTQVKDYQDRCRDSLDMDSPSAIAQLTVHKEETANGLSEIEGAVECLSYVRDLPTGRTPPRRLVAELISMTSMSTDSEEMLPLPEFFQPSSGSEEHDFLLSSMAEAHYSGSGSGSGEPMDGEEQPSLKRSLSLPELGRVTSTPNPESSTSSRRKIITRPTIVKNPLTRRNIKKPRK